MDADELSSIIPACIDLLERNGYDVVKRDELLPEATCKNCQRTATDYENLRLAGDRLALASMRVVKDYDGIHRLRFAIGEWEKAIAGEGGRDERKNIRCHR